MKRLKQLLTMLAVAGMLLPFAACNKNEDEGGNNGGNNGSGSSNATTYDTSSTTCGGNQVTTVTISENGKGTGTVTLQNDIVYILDGYTFVNSGQTLTIEPGTVIKGESGTGENASALIVTKNAKIMAEGTASNPIVFTSVASTLTRDVNGNKCGGGNLNNRARGYWGGVLILGKAPNNTATGEVQIEGIPSTEPRGAHGMSSGADPSDNSGVFKYVSIRHGGSNIGANNEINGLSLGSVGSGTEIHHVEVFANQDDGIEWFGGTANTHHMVMTNCGDDAMDYDIGYTGENQYYLVYQATDDGDRGGEHDGGTDPEDGQPYATPRFFNVTSIGGKHDNALIFRDNAGGQYHNSVFHNYNNGIWVEDLNSGQDSYRQYLDSNIVIMNNLLSNVGGGTAIRSYENSTNDISGSVGIMNNVVNSVVSRSDVMPASGDMTSNYSTVPGSFYDQANYNGAFDPSAGNPDAWMEWTKTAQVYPNIVQ